MTLRFIDAPTDYVVLCRGLIGTLTILIVMAVRRRKPNRNAIRANLKYLIISGICLGANWVFLFAAYKATTVALASLLNYMAPMIVILISPFLFKTKMTKKLALCAASAFIGIVLVSGALESKNGDFNTKGVLLGVGSALAFVGITVFNKFLRDIDPLDKTVTQLLISVLVVFPYVKLTDPGFHIWNSDLRSILLTIMLGVLQTGVAYIMYFGGMGVLPVPTFSILGYLEPAESVLLSALVLHEPLSVAGVIGTILIIGAAVVNELPAKSEQ